MTFSLLDIVIVILYMAGTTALGFWIGRKQKSTTDYFLGGRHVPWLAVTLSIVATETSVLTFIGIPAISYQGNLTFIQIVLGYLVGRIAVAVLMIPAYYRGSIETAYHFLGHRFGQKMRNVASMTFMATRLLADGVRLFATAIPLALIIKGSGYFDVFSDTQFYFVSIILIGIITVFYTSFGGIKSVIWVDMIQWIIYISGTILAGVIILTRLPNGLNDVIELVVKTGKTQWFQSGVGLSCTEFIKQPYTFFTAVFGGAVFSLASHGTDQLIVQRVLTCGNLRSSQKAIAFSGVVVLFQFLLFLSLGLLLFAYYQGQTCQQLGLIRADGIFPKFIVEVIPTGVSGLIVSALFAAAMSTLAGSLSSLSSSTVLDIYVPIFGKHKSQSQLLGISRLVTFLWAVLLMGTAIAFINLKGTVVETALGIASYTYGGLLGTFLLGLFSKKARQKDAITGFIVALITMTILIQLVNIAWPLYTLAGSITTVTVGIISSSIVKSKAAMQEPKND
jgi:SSS family transporter